jgi:hypothetical protein
MKVSELTKLLAIVPNDSEVLISPAENEEEFRQIDSFVLKKAGKYPNSKGNLAFYPDKNGQQHLILNLK